MKQSAAILKSPTIFWSILIALAGVSILLRLDGATPDISWLIDMCARILAGERAYIDIFETTPPIPTLLYMPAVIVANKTGLSPEAVTYGYAYLACFLTFMLLLRILPADIDGIGSSRWAIIAPSAIFLFILSTDAFAQREFFSAIFSAPIIAVIIHHMKTGEWPSQGLRFWAAFLCGFAVAIKPPIFALPIIGVAGYYMILKKDFRFIYSSGLAGAALFFLAITALSFFFFPEYLNGVRKLMQDIYVPLRAAPAISLQPAFTTTLLCMGISLFFYFNKKSSPAVMMFLIMAIGYAVIYFLQGKFFSYHSLPTAFYAFIALWMLTSGYAGSFTSGKIRSARPIIICLGVILTPLILFFMAFDDARPRMHNMDWAKGLNRPTAMAITPSISLSFPLARKIDARWIDRIHSQWVSHYARIGLGQKNLTASQAAVFSHYLQADLDRVSQLIIEEKPEIIIQCISPDCEWITEKLLENNAMLLNNYETIAEENIFRILRKRQNITTQNGPAETGL